MSHINFVADLPSMTNRGQVMSLMCDDLVGYKEVFLGNKPVQSINIAVRSFLFFKCLLSNKF